MSLAGTKCSCRSSASTRSTVGAAAKGRPRPATCLAATPRARRWGRSASTSARASSAESPASCCPPASATSSFGGNGRRYLAGGAEQPNELREEHQHAEQPQDRREDREAGLCPKHRQADPDRQEY